MILREFVVVCLLLLLPFACSDDEASDPNNMLADSGTDMQVTNNDNNINNDPQDAGSDTTIPVCDDDDGQCAAGCTAANDNDCAVTGLGPAPVSLGSKTDLAAVGAYVLLAKTGITNVTGSSITGGQLGLSPAAATFMTGFSLIADSTNVYSTSASVVAPGKLYASNYEPPTPSNLTIAVLAMEAAYSDAAGRSNPDFLNLNSGNLGGQTLAPGLYNWGSSVTIPEDVTIAGGPNDVWILQITDDLDQSAAKNIILSGGAQAKNIFWQVAGQVTIHADAHFEGVILCSTGITLQTNASMNGRALSQTLIALDDNAITAP